MEKSANTQSTRRRIFDPKGFLADVSKLMVGAGAAQVVTVLGSLLLARLFLPEEFVGVSLLTSVAAIFSRVSQMKYETAIAAGRNRPEIAALAAAANVCLWAFAIFSLVGSLVALPYLLDRLGITGTIVFIICLPLTVLFNGWLNTANTWAIRWRHFNQVAANEFIRNSGAVGTQALAGLLRTGAAGLMTGQTVGTMIAYFAMTWRGMLAELKVLSRRASWRRVRAVAWMYRDFAMFQTPKALINGFNRNLPPILLAAFYPAELTGLFWYAFRLTLLPANLLGVSISRVLMQRFANLRLAKRPGFSLLIKSSLLFLLPSIPMIGILAIWGPELFALVLGEKWRDAGEIAIWTSMWSASIMIGNPGERYLIVNRRNALLFGLEFAFLPLRLLPFPYFAAQGDGMSAIIWCCLAAPAYSLTTTAVALVVAWRGERGMRIGKGATE